MEMMLWNMALSIIVGVMGYILKDKFAEIQRLGILLNKTREEVAREHITRAEVKQDLQTIRDHFDDGFARLESKIDQLRQENKKG